MPQKDKTQKIPKIQWSVNNTNQRILQGAVNVPDAAMRKYEEWRKAIERGKHPKVAAEETGDLHYEQLQGGYLYTIRLSGEHRVVFQIYKTLQQVEILKIGGHYP